MPSECRFQLLPLGTGKGATAVYEGEPSSAFVLRDRGHSLLLIDIGFGITRRCIELCGGIPPAVLVTHNHSDHAAELPVVLAVEKARDRRLRVISATDVMDRLKNHRLHELRSALEQLNDLAYWVPVEPGVRTPLDADVEVELRQGIHSEASFGCLFYSDGRPLFAYSADSGMNPAFYDWMAQAPTLIVDGRRKGSTEHAGFDEIEAFAARHPDHQILVTGYGTAKEAPEHLPFVRSGEPIPLAP